MSTKHTVDKCIVQEQKKWLGENEFELGRLSNGPIVNLQMEAFLILGKLVPNETRSKSCHQVFATDLGISTTNISGIIDRSIKLLFWRYLPNTTPTGMPILAGALVVFHCVCSIERIKRGTRDDSSYIFPLFHRDWKETTQCRKNTKQ